MYDEHVNYIEEELNPDDYYYEEEEDDFYYYCPDECCSYNKNGYCKGSNMNLCND